MKLAYMVATPEVQPHPNVRGMRGDLDKCFAQLAQIGYSGVELSIADPGEVAPEAERIADTARARGLEIAAICTDEMAASRGVALGSDDREVMDRSEELFLEAVAIAGRFGCPINIGKARGLAAEPVNDVHALSKAVARVFGGIVSKALDQGTQIVLEPIPRPEMNWICDTETALNVVVRVNRPTARLLLDTACMYGGDASISTSLDRAAPFVRHVHLAEEDRSVPGTGSVDFAGFIHQLHQNGYAQWLTVEVEAQDHAAAARQSFEFLSRLLPTDEI